MGWQRASGVSVSRRSMLAAVSAGAFIVAGAEAARAQPAATDPVSFYLGQVLALANSATLQAKIAAPEGRVAKLLAAQAADEQVITELYLAALSRLPLADEIEAARRIMASAPNRQEGCEDLLWTILNLTEFGFNH